MFFTPNGADIAFCCYDEDGRFLYCKEDKNGRPIRAIEWVSAHLAGHLGIPTPDTDIIEDPDLGTTVFGSVGADSPAGEFEVKHFLTTPQTDELGGPSRWLAAYLARLYVFDLFIDNPDRSLRNFLLSKEGLGPRLCAFDFASARLARWDTVQFPIASEPTVRIGKYLRNQHGFARGAANEMIDRIAAIPLDAVEDILKRMPADWMSVEQREGIRGLWPERRIGKRLDALRAGIADGSLL